MYGFFYCLSERIPLPVDTKAARVEPTAIGKWAGTGWDSSAPGEIGRIRSAFALNLDRDWG
jgi:hypothetical protein